MCKRCRKAFMCGEGSGRRRESLVPAHHTKHIPLLAYPYPPSNSTFHLAQRDDGHSNGTALWLGSQCLALYLATIPKPPRSTASPRAIELGSGIGLSALALSALGWDVLATDIPHVLDTVLSQNISNNICNLPPDAGIIQARVLDWTVSPDNWCWDNPHVITNTPDAQLSLARAGHNHGNLLKLPFDLIYSADTVYLPSLVQPLLRTFHTLASSSTAITGKVTPTYLCIERRDPALVDGLLSDAKAIWGFTVDRIPHRKLTKLFKRSGMEWDPLEWEGVEIWKLTLAQGARRER